MDEDADQIRREIPDEFLLVPPDGGDVKTHEGVASMRDRIEALEAENARLEAELAKHRKPFWRNVVGVNIQEERARTALKGTAHD